MKTGLQIVQRGDLYVVQIKRKRLFHRCAYWIDLHDVFMSDLSIADKSVTRTGYQPVEKTKFENKKNAKDFCIDYLQKEMLEDKNDIVIQTFNTGIDDRVWPKPPPKKDQL